jgi:hypothetical protein
MSYAERKVTAGFSDEKRFTQAFMDSVPVVGFVLILVTVHLVLILAGTVSVPFEFFASAFFLVEVSARIWAHTPYYFFFGYERKLSDMNRWLNCIDFCLSASDIAGMVMTYGFSGSPALTQGAKSARLLRVLKIAKCARMLRMWKVLKMFFLVFARERDRKVMERRQKVAFHVIDQGFAWQIDRTSANIKEMTGEYCTGLDLSGTKPKGSLQVAAIRRELDKTQLRKHKVVDELGVRIAKNNESGVPISMCARSSELCVEFGPVIGMYFWTMELFGFAFLLVFLVSLPSTMHYRSNAYSDGTASGFENSGLYGSAVCNNSLAVSAFVNKSAYDQFVAGGGTLATFATAGADLMQKGLVQPIEHNACYLGDVQLITSICVVVILTLTYAYFYVMFKRFLVTVTEMRQTSSDYSLVVNDPPSNAYDPDEWEQYFSPYGEVVAVTILVDNGELLERLAKRRYLKTMVESMGDKQYRPSIGAQHRALLNSFGVGRDKVYYIEQYQQNEMALHIMMREEYQVTKVYVTFEHQAGQRGALMALQQGTLPAALDIAIGLPAEKFFRAGTEHARVLDLKQAPEPGEILFQNTGLASSEQRSMQKLVMLMFLGGFMWAEFALVSSMKEEHAAYAGLVITFANSVVPEMLHVLSHLFEVHEAVGEGVESVYNKVSLFRYFNTVIIIHMLTDWSNTLDEDHLNKVQSILIFDAFLTPFLYAFNIAHYFNRYIIANLVTNELDLRQALSGAHVRMSDRYSNLAKCMFVGLFYLPLLPTGAGLAFLHCALSCVADRAGLTHQWKPIAPSGAKTLFRVLSGHVAFAIITHLYMAMFFFSGWTYDSACPADPGAIGGSLFYTCDKHQEDLLKATAAWMSDEQAATVLLYKWTFVIALVGGIAVFMVLSRDGIKSLFVSTVRFDDADQNIPWSTVDAIHLFVPKCELAVFPSPLLACDSSALSNVNMSWDDDDIASNSVYNDAQELVRQLQVDPQAGRIWSTVTQLGAGRASGAKARKISIGGAVGTENPLINESSMAIDVAGGQQQVV